MSSAQAQERDAERVAAAYLAALADSAYTDAAALVDPETASLVATRLRGEPETDDAREAEFLRRVQLQSVGRLFERRTGLVLSEALEQLDPVAFHALLLEHGFAGQGSWTAIRVGASPIGSTRDGEFTHVLFRYEGEPVPGQAPGLFTMSTREAHGRWYVVPLSESHERIGM